MKTKDDERPTRTSFGNCDSDEFYSYVLVCYSYVLVCYSYIIVCYSYVLVCYSCALVCYSYTCTRMLFVCTRMLLVWTRKLLVGTRRYSYVTRIYSCGVLVTIVKLGRGACQVFTYFKTFCEITVQFFLNSRIILTIGGTWQRRTASRSLMNGTLICLFMIPLESSLMLNGRKMSVGRYGSTVE